jgi:hypothetical protein
LEDFWMLGLAAGFDARQGWQVRLDVVLRCIRQCSTAVGVSPCGRRQPAEYELEAKERHRD